MARDQSCVSVSLSLRPLSVAVRWPPAFTIGRRRRIRTAAASHSAIQITARPIAGIGTDFQSVLSCVQLSRTLHPKGADPAKRWLLVILLTGPFSDLSRSLLRIITFFTLWQGTISRLLQAVRPRNAPFAANADVRYGSLADTGEQIRDVRFTRESEHVDLTDVWSARLRL